MNSILLSTLCLGMASVALTASAAEPVKATVVPGSFHCFPAGAPVEYVTPDGSNPCLLKARRVDKLGNSKWDNTDGHDLREIPTEGSPEILVILVQFADQKFAPSLGDPNAIITDMLNGDNFTYQGAAGSARAFYSYTSAGQFTPKFNVVGPVTVSKNEKEYVTPSVPEMKPGTQESVYPASRMIEEAVKLVDDQVDFAKYDSNSDGTVDFVYVFFAGRGATTGGNRDTTVWPHAFTLTSGIGAPVELDGVKIDRYCCSAEVGQNGKLSGIGTFCHEFGHVLGLPDLYDTSNNNGQASKCFTPGTYDCMDGGNYNNDEHSPATFSIYEQYALEWTRPVTITGAADLTLLPLAARSFGYKVNTSKAPTEYFLFENRAPVFNDRYLEGHGMIAWHIDFNLDAWTNNVPNNIASHQRIDIEEADGTEDRFSRDGDVFPGTAGVHEFFSAGVPSFADWDYNSTGYDISNIIRHPDGTVSFSVISEDGKTMAGTQIAMPVAEVKATSSSTATLAWQPVEGATGYMVSVYDPDHFDGVLIKDFVDGYCFRNVGEATSLTVEGLKPGKKYAAYVYAINDANASRMDRPVEFATLGGDDINAATNLYAHCDNGEVTISWDTAADADRYELTLALPLPSENVSETQTTGFDGKLLPEGWTSDARYWERDTYCGQATPSLRFMTAGQKLTTSAAADDIRTLSFWACKHDSEGCFLDVYGVDANGSMLYVDRISDLTKEGKTYTLAFPEGMKKAQIVFFSLATGQSAHVDDIVVARSAEATQYVPLAADKAQITMNGISSALVKGLEADTEYAAYVTPYKGEQAGTRSNVLRFVPSKALSGVEEITDGSVLNFYIVDGTVAASEPDALFNVYSLDGKLLAVGVSSYTLPARGLYIVRNAGKSAKLCW